MSSDSKRELLDLATAHVEAELSADQAARLAELVAGDVDLRRLYVDFMQMQSVLERDSHPTPMPTDRVGEHEHDHPVRPKSLLDRASQHSFGTGLAVALVGVAALLFVLAFTPISPFVASDRDEDRSPVAAAEEIATLTNWHRPEWVKEHAISPRNHRITAGQKIAFTSGLIEITYDTGAKVVIEGPAEFVVGAKDQGERIKDKQVHPSSFILHPSKNSG
ncbi:MAG: hypothetical protein MI757_03890, partial [Pirellulales bacterium]|nr:hypothetical protein [Pirellulales bacterium]